MGYGSIFWYQYSNLNSKVFTSCTVGGSETIKDVNSLPLNTIAYGYPDALNIPVANNQYVFFTYASTDSAGTAKYVAQQAVKNSSTINEMWVRFNCNGTWTSWKRLTNTDDLSYYATTSNVNTLISNSKSDILNNLITTRTTTKNNVAGSNTKFLSVTFDIPSVTGYSPFMIQYQSNNSSPSVVPYVSCAALGSGSTVAELKLTLPEGTATFNFTANYTALVLYIKNS